MPLDTPSLDAQGTDLRDAADRVPPSLADTLNDAAAPATSTPELPIKSREDLKRLNRRATQEGMYGGMLAGGVLTYAAHRLKAPKNALVPTFLLTSTCISFLWTRSAIRSALGAQAEARKAISEPVAPGGGTYLGDLAPEGAPKTGVEKDEDPRSKLVRELEAIPTVNMPRERTMWAKGRGLQNEVEEEPEMGDAYLRAGVPRREV